MHVGRSLLFIPANRERFYQKAPSLAADSFVVDLEDGVPIQEKDAARSLARRLVGSLVPSAWIRINALSGDDSEADLDAVVGLDGVLGLVVPKADSPDAIAELDASLGRLETARNVHPGSTHLITMIESSLGVLRTFDIASATRRIKAVCFGGARDGDLQNDLGSGWSVEGPELLYARQHVLLATRAVGIDWPLDGVFADVSDPDAYTRDCMLSRSLGYRGRMVIHPSQIDAANQAYSPTLEELDHYERVIEQFAVAENRGEATALVDGRLIDYAMVRTARRVVATVRRKDDDRSLRNESG